MTVNILNHLSSSSSLEVDNYFRVQTQVLLLKADKNFGVNEVAENLAEKIFKQKITIIAKKANPKSIEKISVDDIRSLRSLASLKNNNKKVFLILSADKMTKAAQNAFLKLLEEPPLNTFFILSTENDSNILPTIKSRSRVIKLKKLSSQESQALLEPFNIKTDKLKQIIFLADGLPGELMKLSNNETYFETRLNDMKVAKNFMTSSTYDKLLIVKSYKEDRAVALKLIEDCLLIIKNTISTQVSKEMLANLDKYLEAKIALNLNQNVRLTLMSIVV